MPIECPVDLRLAGAGEWTRLSATNISMSGMFIHTAEMHPEGTALEVRFKLQNRQLPILGRAEVLWRRMRDAGPDQPRGIGVRFLDLDLESKYAISRLVDRYRQLVRMPFHRSPSEDESGTSARRSTRGRNALALAFVAGVAAGALGSYWLFARPGDSVREAPGIVTAAELTAREVESTVPAPIPVSQEEKPEKGVEAAVGIWARAWAAKDVERYLGCYAGDFQPASEMTLDAWKTERRDRLTRPGAVEVRLSTLEIEIASPDWAIARFDQAYSAPGYQDLVRKALELSLQDGEWKIRREQTIAQLPAIRSPQE